MSKLEVDFSKITLDLARLTQTAHQFGEQLDKVEGNAKSMGGGISKVAVAIRASMDKAAASMHKFGGDIGEIKDSLMGVENIAKASMMGIVTASMQAQVKVAALNGQFGTLGATFRKTAADQSLANTLLKVGSVTTDLTNREKLLEAQHKSMDTTTARTVAVLSTKIAGLSKLYTSETRQSIASKQLTKDLALQGTATGRSNAIAQARIGILKGEQTEVVRLSGTLDTLKRREHGLTATLQDQAAVQRAANSGRDAAVTFIRRQGNSLEELRRQASALGTTLGRQILIQGERNKAAAQDITFTQRQATQLAELKRVMGSLDNGYAGQIALLNRMKRAKVEANLSTVEEGLLIERLQRRLLSLTTGRGREVLMLKETIKAKEAEVTAGAKESAQKAELTRRLQSLNGGIREQNILLGQQVSAREREITEEARQIQKLAELQRAFQSLNGGIGESIVRQQELINQRKRAIAQEVRGTNQTRESETVQRRANQTVSAATRAHAELNKVQRDATERLARLEAQSRLLNTSYGRNLAIVQRKIAQQTHYNKLLSMGRLELLGLASAQDRVGRAFNASNQTGAMLRATLAGLQTNIGMYTSSTILAAAATYAFSRAVRSSLEVGTEFGATMARVDAIMGGSAFSGMASGIEQMETQVRALGQTTIFTASEVGGGLVELGMAGLSASQAMVALAPSLDLAMIGNIGMAESADIATNVMQTFGMQARDLGHVVDVMAMAITNSNTNISQLANAISYVGPAAQAAGFSLKDTTAAIEVLSNTGIKASRAGTGLRRMFANLLNPTAKGTKVMQEYGISVMDFEGNSRSLSDVLGQLHKALNDDAINPAERLSAVVDLVGVRAASAVSALIGQGGSGGMFEILRSQLESAEGAAAKMRDTIQDTLQADWKRVLSSFQEVQITALQSQEERLKLLSAQISSKLINLTKPFEEGSAITNLDLMLAKTERWITLIATLGAGYVAFKLFSGSAMAAAASDLQGLALRIKAMQATSASTNVQVKALSITTGFYAGLSSKAAVSTSLLSTKMGMAGLMARGLATGLSFAATAASFLSRSMGWIGLLGSIGYGLYSFFSSDDLEMAEAQEEANKKLVKSYRELVDSMNATAESKGRLALQSRSVTVDDGMSTLLTKKQAIEIDIKYVASQGLPTDSLELELGGVELLMKRLKEESKDLNTQLEKSGTTTKDIADKQAQSLALIERLRTANQDLKKLQIEQTGNHGFSNGALDRQKALIAAIHAEWVALNLETQDVHERLIRISSVMENALNGIRGALAAEEFDATATNMEKLLAKQKELAAARNKYEKTLATARAVESMQVDGEVIHKGITAQLPDPQQVVDLGNVLKELSLEEQKLKRQVADDEAKVLERQRILFEQRADYGRSDAERLEHMLGQLVRVDDQLNAMSQNTEILVQNPSRESQVALEEERFELMKNIDTLRTNMAKPEKNPAGDKAAQELKALLAVFKGLKKEADPVAASLESVNERLANMAWLLEKGHVSLLDYNQVAAQLQMEHYEVVAAQDKHRESLLALQDTYKTSPFASTLDDLAELNILLEEGKVKLEEYARLKDLMMEKAREDAINGAPEANFRMQGSASTPFTELGSTMIEVAEGRSWFGTRQQELDKGSSLEGESAMNTYDAEIAELDAQLAAKALIQGEYDRRTIEAEDAKNAALRASQEKLTQQSVALTDQRKQYEEESSKLMMISMLGSAEQILGMFAATGDEATNAQKAAFVAQKALAVAQILMYAHVAASRAPAEAGIAGIPLGTLILAQGYASAGLVAGLAIGQLTSGGSESGGGSSYSGAYDNGGWIPEGKWGVVGEYGPEMVHGPAGVTGRNRTAAKSQGGGDTYDMTFAPVVQVTVEGSESGDAAETGRVVGETVKNIVLGTLAEQMRPNGMIDQWSRSNRRG